jgi:hypothetical protein
MKQRILTFMYTHWIACVCGALFFLLLLRNPFSVRTLIPNLEPFPDSFHYIDPAFSFLQGKGFVFEREGRTSLPSVPPLYSIALAPLFVLISDVRAFYLTNVISSAVSFVFFYSIIRIIFPRNNVRFVVLLLYTLSAPLNWFPQLAMAENLLLTLFLAAVLLLIIRVTPRRALLAGFLAVSFYATKYASLPLTVLFPLLYGVRLIIERKKIQREPIFFVMSLIVCTGLYALYEYWAKGNNVIGGLFGLFFSVVFPKPAEPSGDSGGAVFFGTQFMSKNISAYTGWLLGNPITILWKQIIILPKILAIPAVLGLFLSLRTNKHRWIGFSLLSMLTVVIAFMSVFYAYDGRYFFIAIPTLFIGFGFFCTSLYELFATHKKYVHVCMIILTAAILILNARQVKFWIGLNLKYSETPWYYISIRLFDSYVQEHAEEFGKTPVIISALPPYLIDAYAKQEMILLPLDAGQEFRSRLQEAWGDYDFEHLDDEYTRLMEEGHPVLLTKYGLGNEQFLLDRFAHLLEVFDARKVQDGCFSLCDIYELSAKK